jgi:uncharacterized membrane protein YkvA (DUF1232 family)
MEPHSRDLGPDGEEAQVSDTTIAPEQASWTNSLDGDELEQRVHRLEEIVADLCNTQILEDRVAARVAEQLRPRLQQAELDSASPAASAGTEAATPEAQVDAAAPPPGSAYTLPVPLPADPEMSLIREVWSEVRLLLRMVRDPIYSISWLGIIVPLFALVYVVFPWKFWPLNAIPDGIYLIGLLDDLVVAYVGFKVLGRELRRYRGFLARRMR